MRVALVMICLAASASAAFLIWTSERQARAQQSAVDAFTSTAHTARVAISELRGAQQGYVAAGQSPDFWFARVTSIVSDLRGRLASLKSLSASPEAGVAIEDAGGALQDFDRMDKRARDLARARQLSTASDLIFADGFDLTKRAGDAIDQALRAELADRGGVLEFLKRRQQYALASGSVVAALVLLLLAPGGRKIVAAAPELPATPVVRATPVARATPVVRAAPEVRAVPEIRAAPEVPAAEEVPAAQEVPATEAPPVASHETLTDLNDSETITRVVPAPPEPGVDMTGVAEVCADLAKVSDTRALPAILGRAAGLLDAAGVVVWIADPDGRELAPILVHGYPPQLATRLGTIGRDAANVTASAYRTGLVQTMKGDSISDGAIAAPLVSTNGCVGVLAAETRNGGEQREAVLAAAEIIAAQLSMLVGPPSARPARNEAAG